MRSLKTLALSATLVVGMAAPAAAHVSVQPPEASQGGFAKLTFRVPNERDDASTVELEVQLPAGDAFAGARVKPLPGWTVEVSQTTITWSGGTIAPGQFQEFEISAGPLPEVDEVTFKTLQTYDDGAVVSWIEEATEGGEEPEHPAPVLQLTAGDGEGDGHGAVTATATATDDDDDDGNGAVVGAYVLGGLGVLLAAAALVSSRRRSPT